MRDHRNGESFIMGDHRNGESFIMGDHRYGESFIINTKDNGESFIMKNIVNNIPVVCSVARGISILSYVKECQGSL